jgi:hypothetical protein
MTESAFQPTWFSKPGDTLSAILNRREMTPEMLAECMGREASVVHGLLSGVTSMPAPVASGDSCCTGPSGRGETADHVSAN